MLRAVRCSAGPGWPCVRPVRSCSRHRHRRDGPRDYPCRSPGTTAAAAASRATGDGSHAPAARTARVRVLPPACGGSPLSPSTAPTASCSARAGADAAATTSRPAVRFAAGRPWAGGVARLCGVLRLRAGRAAVVVAAVSIGLVAGGLLLADWYLAPVALAPCRGASALAEAGCVLRSARTFAYAWTTWAAASPAHAAASLLAVALRIADVLANGSLFLAPLRLVQLLDSRAFAPPTCGPEGCSVAAGTTAGRIALTAGAVLVLGLCTVLVARSLRALRHAAGARTFSASPVGRTPPAMASTAPKTQSARAVLIRKQHEIARGYLEQAISLDEQHRHADAIEKYNSGIVELRRGANAPLPPDDSMDAQELDKLKRLRDKMLQNIRTYESRVRELRALLATDSAGTTASAPRTESGTGHDRDTRGAHTRPNAAAGAGALSRASSLGVARKPPMAGMRSSSAAGMDHRGGGGGWREGVSRALRNVDKQMATVRGCAKAGGASCRRHRAAAGMHAWPA